MLLKVENLQVAYGTHTVLQNVHLVLNAGEVMTICGRSGSGRSTLLKAIMGQVSSPSGVMSGAILYDNGKGLHNLSALPAYHRARLGIVRLPETKELFTELTVEENLLLALKACGLFPQAVWQTELNAVYERYPILGTRAKVGAGVLSGGEQQLLAFARSMIVASKAKLFLLDEPAEGLAEAWVKMICEDLKRLQAEGKAILMVEEKMQMSRKLEARVVTL